MEKWIEKESVRILNDELQIKNVSGKSFKVNENSYYTISQRRFAFYIDGLGYLIMPGRTQVFTSDRKKDLQKLINEGGFLSFKDCNFVESI